MVIEIFGSFGKNGEVKTVVLDENLAGVQTFDNAHSGKYRVKSISSVSVYEDHIALCVTLLDGDPNSELDLPEPDAVALEEEEV